MGLGSGGELMRQPGGGSVPVPDPTVLTTQNLQREIATSRENIEARMDGAFDAMDAKISGNLSMLMTRFDGMDKAIVLLHTDTDRHVDVANAQLQKLLEEKISSIIRQFDEKFHSIATQFTERDIRTEQTARDSKVAVDAALQAAKEAVGEQNKSNALAIAKSENTFTKQIDQIGVLIATLQKSIDDKIDDIKSRLQNQEGMKKGSDNMVGFIIGGVGMLIAIASVVISVVIRTH